MRPLKCDEIEGERGGTENYLELESADLVV